jgi:hypothetical protein
VNQNSIPAPATVSGTNIINNFDLGKLNVIILPIRYLEETAALNKITMSEFSDPISEVKFVEHMLGDEYFDTPIGINQIQIFAGMPSAKQVRELIENFPVSIVDTAKSNPNPADNAAQKQIFDLRFNNQSDAQRIINFSTAMSLPNGIIYFDCF